MFISYLPLKEIIERDQAINEMDAVLSMQMVVNARPGLQLFLALLSARQDQAACPAISVRLPRPTITVVQCFAAKLFHSH